MVGALLCAPHDKSCQFGVIFFNNVGYLGMCGHGTIGLVVSLATSAGSSPAPCASTRPSARSRPCCTRTARSPSRTSQATARRRGLEVYLPGVGDVSCDIAWGGNWFCLIEDHHQTLELSNVAQLTEYCSRIRRAVSDSGFPDVDHVELFGPSAKAGVNSKNFVLCPGKATRPLALRHRHERQTRVPRRRGKLAAGDEWVQESIVVSVFRGKYRKPGDKNIPTITGTACVAGGGGHCSSTRPIPFAWGVC